MGRGTMFIGERIDGDVARALWVDGLNVSQAADRLSVTRDTIRAARHRIDRNLRVLGLDHLAPAELRAMIQRLIENASELTTSAA